MFCLVPILLNTGVAIVIKYTIDLIGEIIRANNLVLVSDTIKLFKENNKKMKQIIGMNRFEGQPCKEVIVKNCILKS